MPRRANVGDTALYSENTFGEMRVEIKDVRKENQGFTYSLKTLENFVCTSPFHQGVEVPKGYKFEVSESFGEGANMVWEMTNITKKPKQRKIKKPQNKKYVDLHTHTVFSDGLQHPEQNVIDCATIGMDAMAITDHDTVLGVERALEEAKKWPIEVIAGVEISTLNYHILGYCIDIYNKELRDLLKESRTNQDETVTKRTRILAQHGMPISFEKVYHYFPDARRGKMNIVYTMMKDPEIRQFTGNMTATELFKKYVGKGGIAYKIEGKTEIREEDAVNAIINSGGIPIVAHPFKDTEKPEDLEELLELGVKGLEIQPNYNGRNEAYKKFAEERGLIITYGSDYHGSQFAHRPLLQRGENQIEKFW